MNTLYIMCGLAFSGKSTLSRKIAEHIGAQRIAFDELWTSEEKAHPITSGAEGWKYIRQVAKDKISEALKSGESVVYDDNNPRLEHRNEIRQIADKFGAKSIVIYLNTTLELIRQRELENRSTGERHEVEQQNFQKVLEDLEEPTSTENVLEFTPTTNLEEFLSTI